MNERDHVPPEIIAAVVHQCALDGCDCTPYVDVLELVQDLAHDGPTVGTVIDIHHAPECSTKKTRVRAWN